MGSGFDNWKNQMQLKLKTGKFYKTIKIIKN